jgi:hypothetical protein
MPRPGIEPTSSPMRPGSPTICITLERAAPPTCVHAGQQAERVVAEADGNRTRLARIPGHIGLKTGILRRPDLPEHPTYPRRCRLFATNTPNRFRATASSP